MAYVTLGWEEVQGVEHARGALIEALSAIERGLIHDRTGDPGAAGGALIQAARRSLDAARDLQPALDALYPESVAAQVTGRDQLGPVGRRTDRHLAAVPAPAPAADQDDGDHFVRPAAPSDLAARLDGDPESRA